MFSVKFIALSLLSLSIVACGGGGSDMDGGSDAGDGGRDASRPDTGIAQCTSNDQCDDGRYCNGLEYCLPASPSARIDGCVLGSNPCAARSTCDEATDTCSAPTCSDDMDADGFLSIACGGGDCDDHDPLRNPGRMERCDALDVDEDCDLTTFGDRDLDGDGFLSSVCCNRDVDGVATCGDDCDDSRADIHPGVTEVCNHADDDCDGMVDEDSSFQDFYEDCDGDGFGRVRSTPIHDCAVPSVPPSCLAGPGTPAWVTNDTDCDDMRSSVNPGEVERCDSVDDNCDGAVDEEPAATAYCTALPHTTGASCDAGRCVVSACAPNWNDCDGTATAGCESDSQNDSINCGGCGMACSLACASGSCDSVVELAMGTSEHSCARLASGRMACWGRNFYGQLGDGATRMRRDPGYVAGITDAIAIGVGDERSCALRATGRVLCWGSNSFGQLGDGTMTDHHLPTEVVGLTDAIALALGRWHSCAIRRSGQVVCWGSGERSALGDGALVDRAVPVDVTGLTDAVQLTAGSEYTCALRSTGATVCWGDNSHGQLGDGTTTRRTTLVAVMNLPDAVALSAGHRHTCAIRGSGQVVCWGDNTEGELGDGTRTDRHTPVAVSGLSDATVLASGAEHGCAIRRSGQAVCWGRGAYGALGNGSPARQLTPVDVSGLNDAVVLQAGDAHAGAVTASGRVVGWGWNDSSQVGDGTTLSRGLPVDLLPI